MKKIHTHTHTQPYTITLKLEFYTEVRHKHTESPSTLKIWHRSKISCKPQRRERQRIREPNRAGVGPFYQLAEASVRDRRGAWAGWRDVTGWHSETSTGPQWKWLWNRRTSSRERRLVATAPQEGRAWAAQRGCKCESCGSCRQCCWSDKAELHAVLQQEKAYFLGEQRHVSFIQPQPNSFIRPIFIGYLQRSWGCCVQWTPKQKSDSPSALIPVWGDMMTK